MRKEDFMRELSDKIARLGWPGGRARRIVREIAGHWEELEQEGRERGLDETAASHFARERLGDPHALLEQYKQTMRGASWAGRHPIFSFVVLPPVALVIWFTYWTGLGSLAGEAYAKLLGLSVPVWGSYVAVFLGVKVIYYTGVVAVPAFFWWWARNGLHGFNWRWVACGMCALHGVLNHVTVRPHSVHFGYGIAAVDWFTVLAPLLVAGVAHSFERGRPLRALMPLAFAAFAVALTGCASSKTPQHRGWIGGEYTAARRLNGDDAKGVLITALRTNTPAARSGLREGDLIVCAAGKSINDVAVLQKIVDATQPGTNVPMSVLRQGAAVHLDVRVGRETFTPTRAITVGILMSDDWDPWPNPDFSLVALGYHRSHRRIELDSAESRFKLALRKGREGEDDHPLSVRSSEGWEVWLPIVSFSSRKRILSQSAGE